MTVIYSIGHSTRSIEDLIAALKEYSVEVLADTRSIPLSRRNPQFNKGNIEAPLQAAGIEYQHHPLLHGRRKARPDSVNNGWTEPGFKGYADFMATVEFREGMNKLETVANVWTTAFMCAEYLWWKCHRRMISDQLAIDGYEVKHIFGKGKKLHTHALPDFLKLDENGVITYPERTT